MFHARADASFAPARRFDCDPRRDRHGALRALERFGNASSPFELSLVGLLDALRLAPAPLLGALLGACAAAQPASADWCAPRSPAFGGRSRCRRAPTGLQGPRRGR